MAKRVQLKTSESALRNHVQNSDWRAEYDRHYRRDNLDKRNAYRRLQYLMNKDKGRGSVDCNQSDRVQHKERKVEYDRLHYLQYKDATARTEYLHQYYAGNKDLRDECEREHYLQCNDSGYDFGVEKEESNVEYRRQYYLRKKDTKASYYSLNRGAREDYYRKHYFQNQEKIADYHLDGLRAEYRRKYYLQNKDKSAVEWRGDKVEYNRLYYSRNQERNAEYHDRLEDLRGEYRRLYARGKREYYQVYHGHQRTNQSWRTPDLVREYFESVASRLNVANFMDWYRVSRKQMDHYRGLPLYTKFGSLGSALQYAYPEVNWDLNVFANRGKKSGQRVLRLKIEALLPGTEIIEDYQHPDLNWDSDSERSMELDLWIPTHRIGIEFQGEQHYYNVDSFGPSSGTGSYSERDIQKINRCETRGITLIAIPYWWDGSMESLSVTLYQARPDVFPESHGNPIPREMPLSLSKSPANEKE